MDGNEDPSFADIIHGVRAVVGDAVKVELHEPTFAGREWEYVKQCIDTGWVSSVGAFVNRFERALCDYTGAGHAVAVVNGTAALHIALLLAGVESNDEVLIPSLTFVATANAVAYCGAVPHFIDSCWESLGIDSTSLAAYLDQTLKIDAGVAINRHTGRRVRAIVPVHVFGHPVDLAAICDVAGRFALTVIEDATEALGSLYCNRPVAGGTCLAALSFNGNKIITTGGGGAIVTNDPEIARRGRHLTTTAKVPHAWAFEHDTIGYNYRLPNLNAALGCAQLEQLDDFVERKRRLATRYMETFAAVHGARIFREPAFSRSNYWLNALVLSDSLSPYRDELLSACREAGIMARPTWRLLHELSQFSSSPRMPTPVAEDIQRRVINLPSSPHLVRH